MCISGRNFGSSRPIISRLELTILFRVMFVLTGNSRPTLATVRALCSHVFATNRPYFWVNYNNMLRSDKSQRGRRAPPKRAICFIVLSSFYPAQLCICVLFFFPLPISYLFHLIPLQKHTWSWNKRALTKGEKEILLIQTFSRSFTSTWWKLINSSWLIEIEIWCFTLLNRIK